MTEREWGWVIGLVEGEGSFITFPQHQREGKARKKRYITVGISVFMTDKDTIETLANLLGTKVGGPYRPISRKPHWKPGYRTQAYGTKALALGLSMYEHLSQRRKQQFQKILYTWEHGGSHSPV